MEWFDWLIVGLSAIFILAICILIIIFAGKENKRRNTFSSDIKGEDILTLKNWYITQSESKFFHYAKPAAQMMNAYIFPKVQVDSIIAVKDAKTRFSSAFSACVDFCIFSKIDFSPILVVDLYDNRMGGETMSEYDAGLVRFIKSSGIPIITIEAKENYTAEELKERFEEAIISNRKEVINKKS